MDNTTFQISDHKKGKTVSRVPGRHTQHPHPHGKNKHTGPIPRDFERLTCIMPVRFPAQCPGPSASCSHTPRHPIPGACSSCSINIPLMHEHILFIPNSLAQTPAPYLVPSQLAGDEQRVSCFQEMSVFPGNGSICVDTG